MASCNKPYTVTSTNPKMSGSAKPMKSYMGGGMVKSYQKGGVVKGGMPDLTGDGKVTRADVLKGRGVFKDGGMVTMPRKTAKQEMMDRMMEDPRKSGAYGRNTARSIENAPKYSAREQQLMREEEQDKMSKQMRGAYERATGRKL